MKESPWENLGKETAGKIGELSAKLLLGTPTELDDEIVWALRKIAENTLNK